MSSSRSTEGHGRAADRSKNGIATQANLNCEWARTPKLLIHESLSCKDNVKFYLTGSISVIVKWG